MNLGEVIKASSMMREDLVLYAKKIEGHFSPLSEAVLLELTEEEQDMKVAEVAARKCPGFSYCMEMFLIQELTSDFGSLSEEMEIDKKIDRVIYYIEYDA